MLIARSTAKKLSLAVLLLLSAAVSRADAAGISWFKDFEKASEVAKKTNQAMMIEFWADWCTACKVMDAGIYNNPKLVAVVSDRIVPVRIHFDLQKDMVRKYNVPALPYLVFTNSNGTELMHHRGILGADELTALIKALPADVSELNRLDRILEEDENHLESLVAMARELRAMGFLISSNEYYSRAVKHNDAKTDLGRKEFILLEMGLNFLELKDGKQAAKVFERCLKEFPDSSNRPDLLLNLSYSYILSSQKTKARKSLETLIDRFPQSEASRKAQALVKSM